MQYVPIECLVSWERFVSRFRTMASLLSIALSKQPQLVPTCVSSLPPQTNRFRLNSKNHAAFGYNIATRGFGTDSLALGSTSRRLEMVDSRRCQNTIICRAGAQDKYGQCKCAEDAVMAIMKDAIQHCLNKECDTMRHKVLDRMGQGLAALCRVSVGVAAETNATPIPIPVPNQLSSIQDEDLERVRRMLQLTSLPFNNAYDEDLQRLMKLLQTGHGEEIRRTLSGNELAQICERLGSDLVQCLGPLVMCFPELPLWAKHRALLLPAEVAGKMAFSLLTGPNGRL